MQFYIYFAKKINKFVDKKTSIKEDIMIPIIPKDDIIECLQISNFMLSLFLFLIIFLYNLLHLQHIKIILGINTIFCINIPIIAINIPCFAPITAIIAAIVYPKQNPLYPIIP